MMSCDALIVGAGPAGSACAWKLKSAGLDVLVIDKKTFPRDKPCAGWITPQVVEALRLDLDDYRQGRTLEPIKGFSTSLLGEAEIDTLYDQPISYGIRRCEFDHYLLERSGARSQLGEGLRSLKRTQGRWIINDQIE